MPDTIGHDDLVAMLRGGAARVKANHDTLSKLDSVGGDGDHGTTMARAMGNLEKAIDDATAADTKSLLYDIGWAIMGVDGGATGPLFGMFFMGLSEAAPEAETLDAGTLAAMFEAGLASVQQQTKAKVGDKTMIDALVPAVAAFRAAADAGQGVADALAQAADAADQGADSTKQLAARFGRARNVGEQTLGHADPGATSVSFLFRGFAQALAS